jgi:uncharacterized protein YeaO (DUF488 family)
MSEGSAAPRLRSLNAFPAIPPHPTGDLAFAVAESAGFAASSPVSPSTTCEMAIRVVRLGTPREKGEGLRLGTVRRPPRGVKKEDFARLDYYDQWLPELAPSADLFAWITSEPITDSRWSAFQKKYRKEMTKGPQQRLISLLAALSRDTSFSVGCYCEEESRCHRSILRELLSDAGAEMA